MSNLPPGVTDSMIPGNRPEDIEYDAFWEAVTNKAHELGLGEVWPDAWPEDERIIQLIDWISGEAYTKGYNAGLGDAQLEQLYKDETAGTNEGGDLRGL